MSDLGSIRGAVDAVDSAIAEVAKIHDSIEPTIKKQLASVPEAIRQQPELFAEHSRVVTADVRAEALKEADDLLKKESFHTRVGSFLAPEHVERWSRERCLSRVPFHKDDPTPEALMAQTHRASAAELVGLVDDAVQADRGAVALLIHREIMYRVGLPDATDHDREAAKRSGELLGRLRVPEFDQAQSHLRRISAAQKWAEYWRGAIQGRPNSMLKLMAHWRAAA